MEKTQTCNRCKKSLDKYYANFLDKKYHEVCYTITLVLYKTIRKTEGLDDMSLSTLNIYLSLRQTYEGGKNEYSSTRTLRDNES